MGDYVYSVPINGVSELSYSADVGDVVMPDYSDAQVTILLHRVRSALEDRQATEIANQRTSESSTYGEAYSQAGSQQQLRDHYRMRLRYLEWLQLFVRQQQHVLLTLQHMTDYPQFKLSAEQNVLQENSFSLDSPLLENVECETSRSCGTPTSHYRDERCSLFGDLTLQFGNNNFVESSPCVEVTKTVVCQDPESVPLVMHDAKSSSVDQEALESGIQWRSFRTWKPSQVSLLANVVQPRGGEASPVRHILCLSTVVYEKPHGIWAKDAALRAQGRYCKSCLATLRKQYFPFPSWRSARFCYYTGMYYCTKCHTKRKSVIPARVLHLWDFELQPVCNEALDFLELQRDRPLYFISAVNPALYHKVQLLYMLRFMRLQVVALCGVGVQCHVFRRQFYGEDGVGQLSSHVKTGVVSSSTADVLTDKLYIKTFVPQERRYLMEDSEVWSLADLEDMGRCEGEELMALLSPPSIPLMQESAYNPTFTVLAGKSKTALFLKRLRTFMVYHILQKRCALCVWNSLDICRWCCPSDILELFEKRKVEGMLQCRKASTDISTLSFFSISSMCFSQNSFDELPVIAPHLYSVWSFDLAHVRACPTCGACYHKRCFHNLQQEMSGVMWCRRCSPTA